MGVTGAGAQLLGVAEPLGLDAAGRRPRPAAGRAASMRSRPTRRESASRARSAAAVRRWASSASAAVSSTCSGAVGRQRLGDRRGRRTRRAPRGAGRRGAAATGRPGRARRRGARRARRARPTGAARPPTWARERPSAETERTSTRPSATSAPASAARTSAGWPGRQVDDALDDDAVGAGPHEARSRRDRRAAGPSPVTTMVLPAPVSPVSTVSPGWSGSTASSMTPRSRMRISSITARVVPVGVGHHRAGGSAPALHRQVGTSRRAGR